MVGQHRGYQRVLLVDAVSTGADPPGTVHRIEVANEPLPSHLFSCSTHQFGVAQAVELGRALGNLPDKLVIFGIEGYDFGHATRLSPPVANAVDDVCKRLTRELTDILIP